MKIHLNEMVFYGYHGVHPEERNLGQRFYVTITLETDRSKDQFIDHLEDTVDYSKVYETIRHIMESDKFLLLENCANTIMTSLFRDFEEIINLNVSIKKPSVPIKGHLSSVEVEMNRSRDEYLSRIRQ